MRYTPVFASGNLVLPCHTPHPHPKALPLCRLPPPPYQEAEHLLSLAGQNTAGEPPVTATDFREKQRPEGHRETEQSPGSPKGAQPPSGALGCPPAAPAHPTAEPWATLQEPQPSPAAKPCGALIGSRPRPPAKPWGALMEPPHSPRGSTGVTSLRSSPPLSRTLGWPPGSAAEPPGIPGVPSRSHSPAPQPTPGRPTGAARTAPQ